MKRKFQMLVQAWVAALVLVAAAVHAAEITVIHAVNGDDVGQASDLPIDVQIDGACLLTEVPFRAISEPLVVTPGLRVLTVRLATGTCTGEIVYAGPLSIALDEMASVVAHLNEDATILVTKFTNDVRLPGEGEARSVVRHVADAGSLDVYRQPSGGGAPSEPFAGVSSGEQGKAPIAPDNYNFAFGPAGTPPSDLVFGPQAVLHEEGKATIVFLVGSEPAGSLELLIQILDLTGP